MTEPFTTDIRAAKVDVKAAHKALTDLHAANPDSWEVFRIKRHHDAVTFAIFKPRSLKVDHLALKDGEATDGPGVVPAMLRKDASTVVVIADGAPISIEVTDFG